MSNLSAVGKFAGKFLAIVDDDEDIVMATRVGIRSVSFDAVMKGRVRIDEPVLVISRQNAYAKAIELQASGVAAENLRFVDLSAESGTFREMVATTPLRIGWLMERPMTVDADVVRFLGQWPSKPDWEPWLTGDPLFDSFLRWRPRTLAVLAGDEGSGKSTLASLLALKLLCGPVLYRSGARMTICAWEDDIDDFRDRILAFCNGDARMAIYLADERIRWFEPENDPERMLEKYIERIERETKMLGARIHVCDPWNSFNHDFQGESETRYTHRMLVEFQRITRAYDCTIILVAHLPKREGRGFRPFGLSQVAGSKGFADKADLGLCVVNATMLADIVEGEDEDLKGYRIGRRDIDDAIAKCGNAKCMSREHMVIASDKVKIRGMEKRGMGVRSLKACVYHPSESRLELDPLATAIARKLWR